MIGMLAAAFDGWPLLGGAAAVGLIGYAVLYRNRPDDQ